MINVNKLSVNIKLFNITKKVRNQYKYDLNNNTHETEEMIVKKLTRNFLLGELLSEDEQYIWRNYGSLVLKLDKNTDTIVNLMNDRTGRFTYKVNRHFKEHLEQILGIE